MTRARLVALLLALLLGAGGGVTAALVAADDGRVAQADPLGLGIPYADLDCTGEPVLVVASGDSAGALRPAIVNSTAREEVRYLDAEKSCTARWVAERSNATPRWVAYIGPGDSQELCERRMSAEHRGDNVTFLRAGSQHRAECLCEVRLEKAPVLRPGTVSEGATVIWIRALQNMFAMYDASRGRTEPPALTEDDMSGFYDRRTIARVKAYEVMQNESDVDGTMTTFLWERLADSACGLVDYR